jgi:capsular exopolysaccharide synthesis family protein
VGSQQAQALLLQGPVVLAAALQSPEVVDLPAVRDRRDPLAGLERNFTVDAARPGILRLRVRGERPGEAEALLHAIVRAYLHESASQRQAALAQLRDAHERGERLLREKAEALARSDNPRLSAAEKDLGQARFDLQKARAEQVVLAAREKEAAGLPASEAAVLEYLKDDPEGREILKELDRLDKQIRYVERVSALGGKDPSLEDVRRQQAAVERKLEGRRREVLPAVEARVRERARGEVQASQARLGERVAALAELTRGLEAEVRRLGGGRDAAAVQALREELHARTESQRKLGAEWQAAQREAVVGPPAVWKGEGQTVLEADAGPRRRATAAGGAGAAGLAALAVAWREARRRRVAGADDVAHGLGIPLVGSIPAAPARLLAPGRELPPSAAGRLAPVSEAVDALRTLLLRSAGNRPRVVVVTSAADGEGKTTLATQLAASLARAWRRTVLLDGDMRKPAVHRAWDLPLEPGLGEVLRSEVDLADALQPTAEGRLWLLTAGVWDLHAGQALAHEGPAVLFKQLKESYDFVVVDAPPVLPVADALLLSQHADAVLLAVRAGTSRLPAVHAARQRLAALDAPLLGAVVLGCSSPSEE